MVQGVPEKVSFKIHLQLGRIRTDERRILRKIETKHYNQQKDAGGASQEIFQYADFDPIINQF